MLLVLSINFVVLGKQDIASEFGKKGTVTDLSLFDRKESDIIKTWVTPSGFPEKIQPLFQAINLAEYVIFHVDKLDKFTGEQIIALDSLKKEKGILSHTFDVDESKLNLMIKGTVVENYIQVEQDKIKEEMDKLEPISNDSPSEMVIDHCFDVKGVGTVILGKVTNGKIKQYDNLKLYPAGIDVLIKSIQMHDDPVTESVCPARVGLAVKGAKPDEVSRGDVISVENAVDVKSEIELDFTKNPFFKGDIAENQGCLVSVGLQVKAAKFTSISPLKLKFEKPIVCKSGDMAVILKPESTTIRIIGSGAIL
jgi:selenocysteine-specific translation elongation factor